MASLAPQLRLLNLAGTDRAQTLHETGQSLLVGDGVAAVSILGALDCPFPDDLTWAERVAKALESGAVADVQGAREVIRAADDLTSLFPDVSLADQAERDTLADVLASEDFTTRLADLRSVMRQVRERAATRYRDALVAYEAGVSGVRDSIEALPEWVEIGDDARQEIARHLEHDLPSRPPDGTEIDSLRTVLFKRNTLLALRRDLEGMIEQAAHRGKSIGEDRALAQPVDFELAPLATRTVIHTPEELDTWLASVRDAIANALKAGAPVRLRVRP